METLPALCLGLLLASMGGAWERTEEALSDGRPAAAPAAFPKPDGPLTGTAPPQTTTPAAQLREPTPGSATPPPSPAPTEPTDSAVVNMFVFICVVIFMVVGIIAFYTKTKPLSRTYNGPHRQGAASNTDMSSSEDDDDASLSSNNGEGPEDALSIRGLPSANPVVKFRRARPGKPNDGEIASPPGDLLDMLFSNLNDQ